MPITNLWTLSCVVTQGGQISQITDQDLDPKITEVIEGASGQPDASFAGIMEQKPMFSFTTTDLATALAIIGFDAYSLGGATDFYFQQIAQGGVRVTNTALKMTMSAGMIVPKMLKASQKEKATVSYDVHGISADGISSPITIATGQTLPSVGIVSNLWTMGPSSITVVATRTIFGGMNGIEVDFGINPETEGSDGLAYPTFTGVNTRRPKVKPKGFDMSILGTMGMGGVKLAAWDCYFRKLAPGSTRIANATAGHIRLSGTTGLFKADRGRGTDGKPAEGDWCIFPTFDGTNEPIIISTGSAIV